MTSSNKAQRRTRVGGSHRSRDGRGHEAPSSKHDVERAHSASTIRSESFVFSNFVDCSSPWHPDSTSRAFRRICLQAGVTKVRLHDLRHYLAMRLLAAGVDVRTVAGRLGQEIRARPSTGTGIPSQKLIGKPRKRSDESSRVPTTRLPVRYRFYRLPDLLTNTVGHLDSSVPETIGLSTKRIVTHVQ